MAPRRLGAVAAVAALTAGALTACTASSASLAAVDTPAFGAQVHGVWSDWDRYPEVLGALSGAGAEWVRLDVGWAGLEEHGRAKLSPWYLRRVNAVLDAAKARCLKVMVTFLDTPRWANGGQPEQVPPQAPGEYGAALERLARLVGDRVDAWELWNEPNAPEFFTGTAADYAALVAAGSAAVRRADPGATVVLGGIQYDDVGFLSALLDRGVAAKVDVIGLHPYPVPADEGPLPPDGEPGWLTGIARMRQALDQRGVDHPFWLTELGWSTHVNLGDEATWQRGVTETQQADFVGGALDALAMAHPSVRAVFWYNARDRVDADPHNNGFGLLRRNLSAKPAFSVLDARYPVVRCARPLPSRAVTPPPRLPG